MGRKFLLALSMCLFASSALAGGRIQIDAPGFRYIVDAMRREDGRRYAQMYANALQLASGAPCDEIVDDFQPRFDEILRALSLEDAVEKFHTLVVELVKLPRPDLLEWHDETANAIALAIWAQKTSFYAHDHTCAKCYLTYAGLNYIDLCLSLYTRLEGTARGRQHQQALSNVIALRELPDDAQKFGQLVPAIMHMMVSATLSSALERAIFQELVSRGHFAL